VPNCWHARPIIKSSHVATFCDQFLPCVSAQATFVFDRRDKFEQANAEMKGISLLGNVC
jgi:hypothetical protein